MAQEHEDVMKTYKGWNGSGKNLDKYLSPGDAVDQEMYDYFLEVLPPVCFGSTYVQMGEPCDHGGPEGRARFDTIVRKDGEWVFVGLRVARDVGIQSRFNEESEVKS